MLLRPLLMFLLQMERHVGDGPSHRAAVQQAVHVRNATLGQPTPWRRARPTAVSSWTGISEVGANSHGLRIVLGVHAFGRLGSSTLGQLLLLLDLQHQIGRRCKGAAQVGGHHGLGQRQVGGQLIKGRGRRRR